MSDVPGSSEWPIKTLEDVALVNPPGRDTVTDDETQITFVPMGAMSEETGEVDYSEIRTFGEVKKGYTRFRDNDVLFAKITPCMENGKAAVVEGLSNGIGCVSTEFHVVRCFDELLPKFAWYFLIQKRFRHAAERQMQGAVGQKRVPPNVLKQALLPVPDLNSQQRTIDRIDQLFSRIDEGERALRKVETLVERYRQSVLKAAVTGELTRDWRAANRERLAAEGDTGQALLDRILTARREAWETAELEKLTAKGKPPKTDAWKAKYKEPVAPDIDGLPELPEGWVWASLGQLTASGPQNGLYLPKNKYGSGTPIVRIDDYQTDSAKPIEALNKVEANEEQLRTYLLQFGDVVVNRVNSLTHLGKTLFVADAHAGALFESNMMRLRLSASVPVEAICAYLNSDFGRRRLTADAKHAVNQASINQRDVCSTPVPLSGEREGAAITAAAASGLSVIESALKDVASASKLSGRLRQATLASAFSGRLI